MHVFVVCGTNELVKESCLIFVSGNEEEDDEDTEARLERKYPNLTRQGSSSKIPVVDADEVPPPLPPRPVETLQPYYDEESMSSEEDVGENEVIGKESPLLSLPTTPPPPSSSPPHHTSPPPSMPETGKGLSLHGGGGGGGLYVDKWLILSKLTFCCVCLWFKVFRHVGIRQ